MDGFNVIHCYQTWALRNSLKTRPAKSRSIRHQKFMTLRLNGLHRLRPVWTRETQSYVKSVKGKYGGLT